MLEGLLSSGIDRLFAPGRSKELDESLLGSSGVPSFASRPPEDQLMKVLKLVGLAGSFRALWPLGLLPCGGGLAFEMLISTFIVGEDPNKTLGSGADISRRGAEVHDRKGQGKAREGRAGQSNQKTRVP